MVVGLFLLSTMDTGTTRLTSGIYMAVLGAGMGFLMQITMLVAQNSVEMKDMGVASSSTTLFRTLGSSFGVAIMGALFTDRVQDVMAERAGGWARLTEKSAQLDAASLAKLPAAVREAYEHAVASGTHIAFLLGALVAVVALVAALFVKEVPLRGSREPDAARPADGRRAPGPRRPRRRRASERPDQRAGPGDTTSPGPTSSRQPALRVPSARSACRRTGKLPVFVGACSGSHSTATAPPASPRRRAPRCGTSAARPGPAPGPRRSSAPGRGPARPGRCCRYGTGSAPPRSSSSGNPGPWSRTRTTRPSTVTSTGAAPCLAAFPSRLPRIRSSRRGSVVTSGLVHHPDRDLRIQRRHPPGRRTRRAACSCSSARSEAPSSRATSRTSSTRVRIACARSRTSSVGRPGRQQLGRREQPGHRGAQLVRDVGGDPALRLDPLAAARPSARPPRGPARRSRPVRPRRRPPVPVRPVSPSATLPAAAAALRSRRDSWPPISTPSAQPPKTTETRADDQGPVEVAHDVALRSAKRLCRDRTSPFLTGTAAQTSGTPLAVLVDVGGAPVVLDPARRLAGSDGSLILAPELRPASVGLVHALGEQHPLAATSRAFSSIETRAALWTTRLSASAMSAPTAAIAMLIFQRDRAGPADAAAASCAQLVAEAADRLDPVLPDLGAQPLHMDVDDAGVPAPAVVPDPLQQLVPGEHGAGRARRTPAAAASRSGSAPPARPPRRTSMPSVSISSVAEDQHPARLVRRAVGPAAPAGAAAWPKRRSTARMRATSTAPSNGLVT